LVIVTVFAAGVQSIRLWLDMADPNPLTRFLLKLASCLAAVMLLLTAIIAADALRAWRDILFSGQKQTQAISPTCGTESSSGSRS
jgi:hypothetical protein